MATGYAIAGGLAGKQRLDVLSRALATDTAALLDHIDLRPGQRCVDIGCGGGNVSRELARRVGEDGWVVGIDLDQELLELAGAALAADGITNVEFRCDDAAHLETSAYDLAYARLVLSHVSDPTMVIAAMVDAVRPGGVIAVEDLDISGLTCCPASPAHDRAIEIYGKTVSLRGGDAYLGSKLPALLRAAGLKDLHVTVSQPCGLDGDAKLIVPMVLAGMSEFAAGEGVATAAELADLVNELHRLAADPTVLMGMARMVHVWARRSDEGTSGPSA
jgi:SAM-dependent methyltransferase